MQWLLQDFEDTRALAPVLETFGQAQSWHKVVPFVGNMTPDPVVDDPGDVILFGAYTLWRLAERRGWSPGVVRIAPFLSVPAWRPHLLNGTEAITAPLRDLPDNLPSREASYFLRPVSDAKEIAGTVLMGAEIAEMARKICALDPADLPAGSLAPDTEMLIAPPQRIRREWRVWIVDGQPVTWSLYREGRRVVYQHEIAEDALDFVRAMVALAPDYAPAYVMDVCRTQDGLRIIETNCLNAAGFYAADLTRLVSALLDWRAGCGP